LKDTWIQSSSLCIRQRLAIFLLVQKFTWACPLLVFDLSYKSTFVINSWNCICFLSVYPVAAFACVTCLVDSCYTCT
jgi:hypothetical protein